MDIQHKDWLFSDGTSGHPIRYWELSLKAALRG
jgi:hypothetical protein